MPKTSSVACESQFKGPLFVFGTARSGTSFLMRLVNSIPGVNLVFESEIIQCAYKIFKDKDVLANRSVFEEYLKRLQRIDQGSSPSPNTPLFVQPPSFYDELYHRFLEHRDFKIFIRDLYCAGTDETLIWGDKTADIDMLPTIFQLFPDVRLIFIIRDVRAVVSSYFEHSQVNFYTPCFFWVKIARLARTLQKEKNGSVIIIHYEDLVARAGEIFEQIASFLGQKSDDLSVVNKAHDTSLDKWRERLSADVVRRIEEICFEEMRYYGYKLEYARKPRKLSMFRYGFFLVQNTLALLRNRRTSLRRILSVRAIMKYIRLYCDW